MGLVFLAGVVAARMYSPVVRGEYAMMTTVAAFAMTLTNFGIGEGLIHFLNKGGADLKRTVTVAITGSALVVLFNLLVAILIVPALATAYFPDAGQAGAALAMFAGAMAVVHRNGYSIWIARRRFAPAAIAITLQPVLFFGVLLWAWAVGSSLEELTRGFAITWGIAALLVVLPLLRHFSFRTLERDFVVHFARFISRSYMSVVFTLLNYRLDMFVVAYLAPDLSMVDRQYKLRFQHHR
jgi:O-antigen/teichoic acid export membrane protein